MRHHAEQHQENGHRHHDHVMANAARDNEVRVNVHVKPREQGGAVFACTSRIINLLLIKTLRLGAPRLAHLVPMSNQLP